MTAVEPHCHCRLGKTYTLVLPLRRIHSMTRLSQPGGTHSAFLARNFEVWAAMRCAPMSFFFSYGVISALFVLGKSS